MEIIEEPVVQQIVTVNKRTVQGAPFVQRTETNVLGQTGVQNTISMRLLFWFFFPKREVFFTQHRALYKFCFVLIGLMLKKKTLKPIPRFP